jgi:predicted alpha/beta superfamily hydrolase
MAQVQTESVLAGEKITLHSTVLGEERKVVVRLPEGYDTSESRYPVLYLLDGEFFFQQAAATVQFLSENAYVHYAAINQPIPKLIVVGIVNVDRNRDFTPTHAPVQGQSRFPTSGEADKFLAFLETELIPLIDDRYRTHPYRVLSGWSLGGLFTVTTFLDRPDLFSAYLAISPSLWWDNGVIAQRADSLLGSGSVTGKPLVVTLGAAEGSGMKGAVYDSFVSLFEQRSSDDYSVTYVEIPDEGHRYVPYKALFDGMRALYSDWVLPGQVLEGGLDAVVGFYAELSERWGYDVEVPESAYHRLVRALNGQGDQAGALEIARLAVERYPQSSWAHYRLGALLQRMGELRSAWESCTKALRLERGYPDPDSERLLAIQLRLQDLERELGPRR